MILKDNRIAFAQYINDSVKAIDDFYINYYMYHFVRKEFELKSCIKWALLEAKKYVKQHDSLPIIDALENLRRDFDAMTGKHKNNMYEVAYDQVTWLLDVAITKGW